MWRGSLAMSPHRLTGVPVSRPWRATAAMRRSTAGCDGSFSAATRASSREEAVTYCVRSFEPMEKNCASPNSSGAMATAGTSTMMPSGGGLQAMPWRSSSARHDLEQRCRPRNLLRHRHHGDHHLELPMHGGARQRPAAGCGTPLHAPASAARRAGPGTGSPRPRASARGSACRRRCRACGWSPACPPPIRGSGDRRDTACPRRASGAPSRNRNSERMRPMPSQEDGSMWSSSSTPATLMSSSIRSPVLRRAGSKRNCSCAARLRFSAARSSR